jgi:hypothetical protein
MRRSFATPWSSGRLVLLVAGAVLGLVGCGKSSRTDPPPTLFLVSFHEDEHANVLRDQLLTFEFSTAVDPDTVNPDTLQIATASGSVPVLGLYEVRGNVVLFNPVVDEDDPNRGVTPVNPYGFAGSTTYQVKIPSLRASPLRVLKSVFGLPIQEGFLGAFATAEDFRSKPEDPDPRFAPYDTAVYDTTHSPYSPQNPKGTIEPHDDVLSYTPVPPKGPPPVNPVTQQPDYRALHPTNVQLQLTFTEVMDPRSFQTQHGGNLVMEFQAPGTSEWLFIPSTMSMTPDGKTVILTAATPLAHADRFNHYRVVLDQTGSTIVSRGRKALVESVDVWDDVQKATVRRDVVQDDLVIWTQKEPGESGPLFSATFPLEGFARDDVESDADVLVSNGRMTAGEVVERRSADTTPCTWTWCGLALREPLTQDPSSPAPNPNSKGPSKIQFHFNSFQHAATKPSPGYKLSNAEALVGMNWGPLCSTVIKSTYPRMHIHVMWSDRNSSIPTLPGGLPSTTYANNFDRNPPGFAVRDGSEPYQIPESSASATWYPWKFQRPFTDYSIDKGLVFMAWTERGGDVEQYPKWYSPAPTPVTRIFNAPSTTVNPPVGDVGQFTYYWTQFEFKRMRSVGVTKFFRMARNDSERPIWHTAVVAPSPGNLPGGTFYSIEYRGARFANYTRRTANNVDYYEGAGSPLEISSFTSNPQSLRGLPAIALRVTFEANVDRPAALPFLNGVAFTYGVR